MKKIMLFIAVLAALANAELIKSGSCSYSSIGCKYYSFYEFGEVGSPIQEPQYYTLNESQAAKKVLNNELIFLAKNDVEASELFNRNKGLYYKRYNEQIKKLQFESFYNKNKDARFYGFKDGKPEEVNAETCWRLLNEKYKCEIVKP